MISPGLVKRKDSKESRIDNLNKTEYDVTPVFDFAAGQFTFLAQEYKSSRKEIQGANDVDFVCTSLEQCFETLLKNVRSRGHHAIMQDSYGVMEMAKEKKKSGVGQGTGKKGWNRWKSASNKAKSFKPYTSKSNKEAAAEKSADKK